MSKRPRDVVTIDIPVDSNSGCRIETELTEEELALIGKVTVQWAHLEHALFVRTVAIANESNRSVPDDAKSLLLEKRLKAFRLLARETHGDMESRTRMERLADRMENAKDRRHKISHGLWDWREGDPEKLKAYSFRPGYSYEHPFDLKKLEKLANSISELLFELVFPGGLADVELGPDGSRYPGEVVKAEPWSVDPKNEES